MNKREILLIVTIFILGISLIFFQRLLNDSGARFLTVEVQGEQIVKTRLTADSNREIQVPLKRGVATIKIKNGRARVLPLPKDICPEGICSSTGWIEKPGETIICLPNKMVVRIEGD